MIHQYKMNGYNIVLDVNSGAIHVVDDLMYDMIAEYQQRPKQELIAALAKKYEVSPEESQEAYTEIEELVARRNSLPRIIMNRTLRISKKDRRW